MRRWVISLCLAVAAVAPAPAFAAPSAGGPVGVGISLGDPTGLSAKAWLNAQNALDFAASWSFEDERFAIYTDYLFHFWGGMPKEVRRRAWEVPLYAGVGGKVSLGKGGRGRFDGEDGVGVGVRVPLGISMIFRDAPFDIFVEVAPGLLIVPETAFDLDGALGGRFYF